jgi:hypothetical protein
MLECRPYEDMTGGTGENASAVCGNALNVLCLGCLHQADSRLCLDAGFQTMGIEEMDGDHDSSA